MSDYIPRRSTVVAFRSQGTREIISRGVSTADRSRVSYQEGEMLDSSNAIPCFSWCSDQLVDHDLGSTSDKVTRVTVRSTGLEKEENMCNQGTVSPSRANDSNVQDRGGICTPSLQELTKTAHQSIHRYGILARRQQITLTSEALADLEWWTPTMPMEVNSVPIMEQTHSITIQTDASRLGWGSVCQGEKAGSHWSTEEQEAHINVLELKAAHLAIQSYQ